MSLFILWFSSVKEFHLGEKHESVFRASAGRCVRVVDALAVFEPDHLNIVMVKIVKMVRTVEMVKMVSTLVMMVKMFKMVKMQSKSR